jgi:probable rRNA maturation factor
VLATSQVRGGGAVLSHLRRTAARYLEALGLANVELSLLLVDDAQIRALNARWREKDKATDVLSFPGSEPLVPLARVFPNVPELAWQREDAQFSKRRGGPRTPDETVRLLSAFPPGVVLLGDVVISLDTARRVAKERGVSAQSELNLYLAHGLLHLLGYDHHRPADAKRMARAEARLLGARGMLTRR